MKIATVRRQHKKKVRRGDPWAIGVRDLNRLDLLELTVADVLNKSTLMRHKDPPFWYGVWIPIDCFQRLEKAIKHDA